jgi:hypothetical protein
VPADARPPSSVDISALLRAAFDDEPSDDLSERVTARLALVTTVVEFARLFALAPIGIASAPDDPVPPEEGETP